MANFVNFIYEDREYNLNIDLIFLYTSPYLSCNIWYVRIESDCGDDGFSLFSFKTKEEAQELYDKLRGKNKPEEDLAE